MATRLPLPDPGELSPAQRAVYDSIAASPRGRVRGPLLLLLHSPDLAQRVQEMGGALRFSRKLSKRIIELVILMTAHHLGSAYVVAVHREISRNAGLFDAAQCDALARGEMPAGLDATEQAIANFCRAVLAAHTVDDATFRAVHDRIGDEGTVDLVILIGYYHIGTLLANVAGLVPGRD